MCNVLLFDRDIHCMLFANDARSGLSRDAGADKPPRVRHPAHPMSAASPHCGITPHLTWLCIGVEFGVSVDDASQFRASRTGSGKQRQ